VFPQPAPLLKPLY
jgi:hypothetical protein